MARSEKTISLEESLGNIIKELKYHSTDDEIESVCKKSHSLGRIKTIEEYKRDRDHALRSLLQVNGPTELVIQSDGLKKEVSNCIIPEYTPSNLGIILHQFFCDRTEQMVHLKHNLQSRWTRFALNDPKTYSGLDSHYQKCVRDTIEEYIASVDNARRLSVIPDMFKANKKYPADLIRDEDVFTYLRWLTHLFHTTKRVMSFIAEIQLLPLLNQEQPDAPTFKPQTVSKNQRKWRNVGGKMRRLSRSLTTFNSSSSISIGLSSGDMSTSNIDTPSAIGQEEEEEIPSTSLPVISTDITDIKTKLNNLMNYFAVRNSGSTDSTSEQLKLFYMVYGQFKTVFQQQIDSTTFVAYDVTLKKMDYKNQSANCVFRKPSNWLDNIQIRASQDELQARCLVEIYQGIVEIDPILSLCSKCTRTNNLERTIFALKQHYQAINNSEQLKPTAVANNKNGSDPMLLWRCIYNAVDMRNPMNLEENKAKFSLNEEKKQNLGGVRGSTNIHDAMNLLDTEEGRNISTNAQNMPQDALFAFILLRHIKIRDRRMKCLWYINYMCSIERTITINNIGLSHDPEASIGIGLHLFKTPVDYKISESEFMQYPEIENHDDYYSFEEPLIRVWDQAGKPIVYDAAEDRLKTLEKELLMVSTYYIQNDILRVNKGAPSNDGEATKPDNINIETLSQHSTDRFTILLDIWTVHCKFIETKVKLINLYLEAYHSVYDRNEKNKLAQVIIDLINQSVRLDPSAQYFTQAYEKETECLVAQFDAIQPILKYSLESERDYNYHLNESDTGKTNTHGLPPHIKESKLINLSGDLRTEVHHYILECMNSLSVVSLLSPLIHHCLNMAIGLGNLSGTSTIVPVNTSLWSKVSENWSMLAPLGVGFSEDFQQKVFSPLYVENPYNTVAVLELHLKQIEKKHEHSTPSEKQQARLQAYCDVLQLITSRHQLILSCHRSLILHSIYKRQIQQLEEEPSHAYLRFIPLGYTTAHDPNKDLDSYITEARDQKTSSFENITMRANVPVAVQELDDTHVGRFSFYSKEDTIKILMSRNGLKNVMVTLQAQVAYQNALLITCQQSAIIIRFTIPLVKHRRFTGFSQLANMASLHSDHIQLLYHFQGSFISFQKEKAAVRQHMFNEYASLPAVKGSEEIEMAKCSMISMYSENLIRTVSTYSVRHQIVIIYLFLKTILANYPCTRDAFFTLGGITIPSTTKETNELPATTSTGRAKAILSQDGKTILNLFYIPHNSEIISMFAKLPIKEQTEALKTVLGIASTLYSILSYTCAMSMVGSSNSSNRNSSTSNSVGVQNKGTEHIGGEMLHLQQQIAELDNPCDSSKVLAYLKLYYKTIILSHDVALRHFLRQSLILAKDKQSLSILDSICIPTLNKLTTNKYNHPLSYPILSRGGPKQQLPSWQKFITRYGCALVSAGYMIDVFSTVLITIAPLSPASRQAASGELSALSLLLEDVLFTSDLAQRASKQPPPILYRYTQNPKGSRLSVFGKSQQPTITSKPLPNLPPIEANNLIVKFLTVAIQVEKLRHIWGCNLLGSIGINSFDSARHLNNIFRIKIGAFARKHVLKNTARSLMKIQEENETISISGSIGSITTFISDAEDSIDQSTCLNELHIREAQLYRLQEIVNQQLIESEIKHVGKLLQLSLQELQRDPDTLPLDLWKKPSMKDIPGVPRPRIVEEFVASLKHGVNSTRQSVIELPQNHFRKCLNELSSAVLSREKESYQQYASFYESTIHSLYHQLYLKNQEIQNCNQQIQLLNDQNKDENFILSSKITYNLLLEITALRVKITQLSQQLREQENEVRDSVMKEYHGLLNELAASGITVKTKYEQYRQKIFEETLSSIYTTRQNVSANIDMLKDKISSHAVIDKKKMESVKGEEHQEIQKENIHLSNMLSKMRSIQNWRSAQQTTEMLELEFDLKSELNDLQNDFLQLKIITDQETATLKQQVKELQRSLANEEIKGQILSKTLEQEKHKKIVTSKLNGRDKDKTSLLDKMQEEKIEQLLNELDDKDCQLKTLTAVQEEESKSFDTEKQRLSKTLKQIKSNLHQERHMKLDAFHQIDELISQVHEQTSSIHGRSSSYTPTLFTLAKSIGTITPTTISRSVSRSSNVRLDQHQTSTQSLKLHRAKSEEGRLPTAQTSDVSLIGQGAFKLI